MKSKASVKEVCFGTYRLHGELNEIATAQAIHLMMQHGIAQPLIDTAVKYKNSDSLMRVLERYPNIRIGTKMHRSSTLKEDLDQELQNYGDHLYRALLHRHMPLKCYMVLVQAKADGKLKEIGVSNYSSQQLHRLIEELKELAAAGELPLPFEQAKPDVCQNELHPFLRTTVPQVCQELGIRFEAHSALTHLDEYPTDNSPKALSRAQMAMAYALQVGGGSVVFNSANYKHVAENLDLVELNETQLSRLGSLANKMCHARYPGSETVRFEPAFNGFADPSGLGSGFLDLPHTYILDIVAPQIRKDMAALNCGQIPSKTAFGIPRNDKNSREQLLVLAHGYFVHEDGRKIVFFKDDNAKDDSSKLNRLKFLLKKLRKTLWEHAAEMKIKSKPKLCRLRAIEDPEALPVEIPDKTTLQPFIDLVASLKELPKTAIQMERGVLFPDGRLDFCKQVSQPSFPQLCQAVLDSGVVKHFLIGNNVALANDVNGECEAALARLIRKARGIETFYLAGNAIAHDQVKSLAEALSTSTDARYVWLKMNPIKEGSYHLGKLLITNPRIEVLDLFNTGQCNSGVKAFLAGCDEAMAVRVGTTDSKGEEPPISSGLKHLYLDINAIKDGISVAKLASRFPNLETLSVNVNQLGDKGVKDLCNGLLALTPPQQPPLQRLVLGSNGCSDAVLTKITDVVHQYPSLTIIQLGSYRSTKFFRQGANEFSSKERMLDLATAIADNVKGLFPSASTGYFGFQHTYYSSDSQELLDAVEALGLYHHYSKRLQSPNKYSKAALVDTPIHVQPEPVKYIQSVYRNSM